MADNNGENEFFHFSDRIREIDEEAPFIRLPPFQQLKSPAAIMCVDSTSGETSICCARNAYSMFEALLMPPVLPIVRVVIEVRILLPGHPIPGSTRGARLSPGSRNLRIAKAVQVRAKRILVRKLLGVLGFARTDAISLERPDCRIRAIALARSRRTPSPNS